MPLQGRFMLSFNKADIVDILEQASRWTCRNFIYTDEVARGKITLLSKTPVNADEAYAAFLATLSANNIAIYPSGRYYKLVRIGDAKKVPIPTFVGERSPTPALEQPITKLIRLTSTDADQMKGILGGFLSPQGADIQSIPPDVLIITDIGLNIRRLEKMVEAIDRPGMGDQVRFIQLRWAPAKEIAEKLNQIFQQAGGAPGRGKRAGISAAPGAPGGAAPAGGEVSVSKIMAEERSNKLIVIADEKSFAKIQELVSQLDVPTAGEGGIHVVFLRNANAEDIAATLSALAQGKSSARAPGGGAVPPQPAGQPAGPAAGAARPGGAGATTAEVLSGEVKITADKSQNALVIQAGGSDFQAISRIIEKLDRARRQVFVEAVIMEVNLKDELQVGVGAHGIVPVNVAGKESALPLISAPGRVSSLGLNTQAGLTNLVSLGGFLTGLAGPVSGEFKALTGLEFPSIGLVIQALQSNSDVNVLSTPHLLAADNEESEISVGQNVPFQSGYAPTNLTSLLSGSTTSSTTALAGLSSYIAPIQRQNVELKLKIKPQINEGDNVKLTIEEQTEEIASTDAALGPTTSKRSVKTQIVARDQSTIVIGGLIQDRATKSVKKIPLLGSLPIIGWLFRDTVTSKQKTNLLLFLTPYIIRDESDYRRIYERKRKEQQEFIEAFYGTKSKYDVAIEWDRKAGPFSRIHRAVNEETQRIENGGPGLPGEGMTQPPGAPPAGAPAQAPGAGKDYYDAADEPVPHAVDEEPSDKLPPTETLPPGQPTPPPAGAAPPAAPPPVPPTQGQ
ncbi:MAG TPA: type II secretion system secretin GspD [Anaeromyxobacteraceae bacterium]|nr:type II secretion system secretin GspD [Anaeromyxobacteraceae bacterium]